MTSIIRSEEKLPLTLTRDPWAKRIFPLEDFLTIYGCFSHWILQFVQGSPSRSGEYAAEIVSHWGTDPPSQALLSLRFRVDHWRWWFYHEWWCNETAQGLQWNAIDQIEMCSEQNGIELTNNMINGCVWKWWIPSGYGHFTGKMMNINMFELGVPYFKTNQLNVRCFSGATQKTS